MTPYPLELQLTDQSIYGFLPALKEHSKWSISR